MRNRASQFFLAAWAVAAAALPGCASSAAETMRTDELARVHSILVLPLDCAEEPSAGRIVSGMIAASLGSDHGGTLRVLECPELSRLRDAQKTGPASRPGGGSYSEQEAIALARRSGADAFLTGSVSYALRPGEAPAKEFSAGSADVSIRVRVLLSSGLCIYQNSAGGNGPAHSKLLSDAAAAAMRPLDQYLKSRRD